MTFPDGWARGSHTHDGVTHPTYRKGTGPGVVVIHEIPGITPEVATFAEEVVAAGFTVVMPSLFGTDGAPMTPRTVASSLGRVCVSREFTTLRTGETTPVAGWLRSLASELHGELGGPGVGALGMCFTGGFALAMAVDPAVAAPVLCQPERAVRRRPPARGRRQPLPRRPRRGEGAVRGRAAGARDPLPLRPGRRQAVRHPHPRAGRRLHPRRARGRAGTRPSRRTGGRRPSTPCWRSSPTHLRVMTLVVMSGLPGSGKSRLAAALAARARLRGRLGRHGGARPPRRRRRSRRSPSGWRRTPSRTASSRRSSRSGTTSSPTRSTITPRPGRRGWTSPASTVHEVRVVQVECSDEALHRERLASRDHELREVPWERVAGLRETWTPVAGPRAGGRHGGPGGCGRDGPRCRQRAAGLTTPRPASAQGVVALERQTI